MLETIKKIVYLIAVFACCIFGGNVKIGGQTDKKEDEPIKILGRICGLAAADGISEAKRLMSLDLCEKFDALDDKRAAQISQVLNEIP